MKKGSLRLLLRRAWTALRRGNADAHYKLGMAFEELGRYPEAIDKYGLAANLKPDWAEPHHRLGNVYSTMRRYSDAVPKMSADIA